MKRLNIIPFLGFWVVALLAQSNSYLIAQEAEKFSSFTLKSRQAHIRLDVNGVKTNVAFSTNVTPFFYDDFIYKNINKLGFDILEKDTVVLNEKSENIDITLRYIKEGVKLNNIQRDVYARIRERGKKTFRPKADAVLHPKILGDVVIFDYQNKEILIAEKFEDKSDEFHCYDMEYNEDFNFHTITVPLYVAGNETAYSSKAKFIVDIGRINGIILNRGNKSVVNYTAILNKLEIPREQIHPHNIDVVGLVAQKIMVDDFFLKDEKYVFSIKPERAHESLSFYDGILGAPFFSLFITVFDFKNNKLYLKPYSVNVVVEPSFK